MRLRTRVRRLLSGGLPERGHRLLWAAGQLVLAGALSLVATAGVELILLPSGRYISYGQLWLIFTAALLVLWYGQIVAAPPPLPEVTPYTSAEAELPVRSYPIAERWQRRLSVTSGDPEWFGRVARDRVAGLVAERQRQRHGSDTLDRTILGDELYEFLTAPITRTPSPAEFRRLVTLMEQI